MCVWSEPRRPMTAAAGTWLLLVIAVSAASTAGHYPPSPSAPPSVPSPADGGRRRSSRPSGPDGPGEPGGGGGGGGEQSAFFFGEGLKGEVSLPPLPRPSRPGNERVRRSPLRHRHRHSHLGTPSWLRHRLGQDPSASHFEREIAEVFREVAYGGGSSPSSSESSPLATQEARSPSLGGPTGSRIERTTALSQSPNYDYIADSSSLLGDPEEGAPETPVAIRREASEAVPEARDYGRDLYDMYEGHYADFAEGGGGSEISRRGDTPSGDAVEWQGLSDEGANGTDVPRNETRGSTKGPKGEKGYRPVSRMSWFDALLCANRNLVWILVNFFLGLIFLSLCLLASYRLFSLKACTHLLPRTHFVAVHLLMFVAASFKAVYLFHLAYGNKERIPLVLILLLTNTGFPCFSSAFLIMMMMMFLTADIRVYRPKLFTVHNTSIFIVMELLLCFVADVIVGCAHSKSVLVLSRLMLIVIAVGVIVFYGRKYHLVIQVSQMLKREFQGELKLLVVPAKDLSRERQTGIKHILRNRLNPWCLVMKLSAVAIMILCIIHLCHTIFLISSQIPAWAWWIFHISGCVVEALLALSVFVSAALTQQYDERFSFLYSFLVPSVLFQRQGTERSKENNGAVRNQRVSFSSGTESTQYTSCNTEATPVGFDQLSRTPKAPKGRAYGGGPVKRSATFSHAQEQQQQQQQLPPDSAFFFESRGPPFQFHRAGSASHIYSPGSGSHVSVYGPNLVSRVHISCPPRDTSMLVHEDGFVRIRTQMDPHEARTHGYGSRTGLGDQQGSIPQLHGFCAQHPGRQEGIYMSLSRRRRNSRSSDILQNNFDVPEEEFHPSPRSRAYHANLPHPFGRRESDYESLSRRRRNCRDPSAQQLNNVDREEGDYHSLSRRRRASAKHRLHHMNNLDRPDSAYHGVATRQVSQEDNNDLGHCRHAGSASDCDVAIPAHRRSLRDSRFSPLNLYEEQGPGYRHPPYSGSPSVRHKVSNFPVSPTSPVGGSPVHVGSSPVRSRRQAHFPKPFVRVGSNTSLQAEDAFCADYIPRGVPLRRNHSSAAYYPTGSAVAPPSPVLGDAHRYGSLRLGLKKRRQPALGTINSQLFGNCPDGCLEGGGPLCHSRASSPVASIHKGRRPAAGDGAEGANSPGGRRRRESPFCRRGGVEARSGSADNDWALELIKSSSILTDFYSLKRGDGKDKAPEEGRGKEGPRSEVEEVPIKREEAAGDGDEEVSRAREVEKACGNQESELREPEEVCGNREKEVEKGVCENRQMESTEVERVCEGNQKAPVEVETVCEGSITSVEVEKVCEDSLETSEDVERVCEGNEETEGAPQDKEI